MYVYVFSLYPTLVKGCRTGTSGCIGWRAGTTTPRHIGYIPQSENNNLATGLHCLPILKTRLVYINNKIRLEWTQRKLTPLSHTTPKPSTCPPGPSSDIHTEQDTDNLHFFACKPWEVDQCSMLRSSEAIPWRNQLWLFHFSLLFSYL